MHGNKKQEREGGDVGLQQVISIKGLMRCWRGFWWSAWTVIERSEEDWQTGLVDVRQAFGNIHPPNLGSLAESVLNYSFWKLGNDEDETSSDSDGMRASVLELLTEEVGLRRICQCSCMIKILSESVIMEENRRVILFVAKHWSKNWELERLPSQQGSNHGKKRANAFLLSSKQWKVWAWMLPVPHLLNLKQILM